MFEEFAVGLYEVGQQVVVDVPIPIDPEHFAESVDVLRLVVQVPWFESNRDGQCVPDDTLLFLGYRSVAAQTVIAAKV